MKRADKTVSPTRKRQRKQFKKVNKVSKKKVIKAPRKGSAVKPLNILKKNKKPRRIQANQTNWNLELRTYLVTDMAALSTEWFQEVQPSGLDMFSLTPTMTCVERVYYDEQRSTSQLSGNLPIEFIIAAHNSLEYTYLKRYVVTLSGFYSYFLQFSSFLCFDKLWSVSRLIAMSWTFCNWGRLLLNVNITIHVQITA